LLSPEDATHLLRGNITAPPPAEVGQSDHVGKPAGVNVSGVPGGRIHPHEAPEEPGAAIKEILTLAADLRTAGNGLRLTPRVQSDSVRQKIRNGARIGAGSSTAPKEETNMTDQLITPENLSKELLKSVLDAAFIETSFDSDGDLKVREGVNCFVFPNDERKDRVRLLALFRFKPEASELLRLQAVNRINAEYIIVRAVVGKNDTLQFTWDIPIAGGITKKAFALAVKRFCSIPHASIADCANDVVA